MFKGFVEKLKNKIEEYNQNSKNFVFNVSDLEYSTERNQGEYRFNIRSAELRQKLGNIITSNGGTMSNPVGINFLDFPYLLKEKGTKNYEIWVKVNKKYLVELNKYNTSRMIKLYDKVIYDDWEKLYPGWEPEFEILNTYNLTNKFGISLEEMLKIWRDESEVITKRNQAVFKARSNALNEINQTLSENNIDIENAEIDWMDILPNWCSCEVKEFGNPDNNNLYQPHINSCLWREEKEITTFRDKMVEAIKQGGSRFNDYKSSIIQQILTYTQQQNLTESKLNNIHPNWQNTLRQLTNREKIKNYQNQLKKDIDQLVEAKNKSEQERQQTEERIRQKAQQEAERLKKEKEEKEKQEAEEKKKQEQETKKQAEEQAKQQKLNQKREKTIAKIIIALNQQPPLSNSDLSPQYQNWEEQFNQLTDIQQISNLQDRILADIQARRQDKISIQKAQENIDKVKTGTEEEQERAWENLEKQETEKGYQENQEEINNLKKEKATENPNKYGQEAQQKIEKKLKENGLNEKDLTQDNQQTFQKLKEGQITDPNQLVEVENNLKQNIYQEEANQKIVVFTSRVNKILKERIKSQIKTLKKELLEFISSSNVYYAAKKKEAENLLERLENFENTNTNQNNTTSNSSPVPWKVIVPVLVIGMLLVMGVVALRMKRMRRKN